MNLAALQTAVQRARPLWTALSIALYLAVLAVISWRLHQHWPTDGPASPDRWAEASYGDAVYYPVQAVRDGVNPYDTVRDGDPARYMNRYPVLDILPLYSPLILLIYAPIALLPRDPSYILFAGVNAVLQLVLAWAALRLVLGRAPMSGTFALGALLLASQVGRGNFNSGQFALPLALATVGALQWGDRKLGRSILCLALATFKPTFGGPLGLLLLARRDWHTTLGGFVLGGVIAVLGVFFIFARSGDVSLPHMIDVLARNQDSFSQDPTVVAKTNKARTDLAASIEYLIDHPAPGWVAPCVALLVLAVSCGVVRRAAPVGAAPSAVTTLGALMMLSMLICIYRNVYDLPLLAVPLVACAAGRDVSWKRLGGRWRWLVFVLMLVPFGNCLWTEGFNHLLERFGMQNGEGASIAGEIAYRVACAANGLALTAAWAVLLVFECCQSNARAVEHDDQERVAETVSATTERERLQSSTAKTRISHADGLLSCNGPLPALG